MQKTIKKTQEPNLMSLEEFVNTHPKLVTMRQMRRTINNAQSNQADMWIRRINRRIFVDVDEFFEWMKRKL
jgi:hypothetical protein